MVMRMQDGLAHALLGRAFAGMNPPHRPGRSPEALERMAAAGGAGIEEEYPEMFAAQTADPSHAIHFNLPDGLMLGELVHHALSEQLKAVGQFVRGESQQPDPHATGLQFSRGVSRRWWADFIRGIERGPDAEQLRAQAKRRQMEKEDLEEKRTGRKKPNIKKQQKAQSDAAAGDEEEESKGTEAAIADGASAAASAAGASASAASPAPAASSSSASAAAAAPAESKEPDAASEKVSYMLLPEVLQSEVEQVALAALVEYVTAEVLELAGNRALDSASQTIHVHDVYLCVAQDEELRRLVRWINPCWHVCASNDATEARALATPAEHAPPNSFGLPPVTYVLSELFAKAIEAQENVNASSWFRNSATLDSVARAFARGERLQSPLDRHLLSLRVRPLQFYGAHQTMLLCDKADPETDPYHLQPIDASVFLRFSVADGQDREWEFLLEISPHNSWKGCVSELNYCGSPIGYLARRARVHGLTMSGIDAGEDALRVDLTACQNIGDEQGHSYVPRKSEVSELEAEIVSQVAALKKKLDDYRNANKPTPLSGLQSAVRALSRAVFADAMDDDEERKASDALPSDTAASSSSSSSSSASAAAASSSVAAASAAPASSASSSAAGVFDPLSIFAPAAPAKPKGAPKLTGRGGAISAKNAAAAAAAASAASAAAAAYKPPMVQLGSSQSLASLSALLAGVASHSTRSQVQGEMEATVSQILPLALFSRWGPSLYVHNQPEQTRRAFTVALLDEAMTPSSASASASSSSTSVVVAAPALPQLPIVLLDLIAQFHSFDLPFLEAEASAQLSAQKWLPQPVSRAMYVGQSNNPVEKLGQLATDEDEVLPPIDVDDEGFGDEDDAEEGEDDDEEDEEGEDMEDENDNGTEDDGDDGDAQEHAAAEELDYNPADFL
jgi:hypothetical protein